jgi:hypothetical protein
MVLASSKPNDDPLNLIPEDATENIKLGSVEKKLAKFYTDGATIRAEADLNYPKVCSKPVCRPYEIRYTFRIWPKGKKMLTLQHVVNNTPPGAYPYVRNHV